MDSLLLFVHSILCFVLIGAVMVQRGTGADMGGGFGGGASQTVFGSKGSASFLTRATAILATLFFISCLVFAYMVQNKAGAEVDSVMSQLPVSKQETKKAVPSLQDDIPAPPAE